MRISIGSDHAGFTLKQVVAAHLVAAGHEVDDHGVHEPTSVDYPDQADLVSAAVSAGTSELGVLVCGTGIGMSMAANKVPGVRAAVVSDTFSARATREHNDANVLCLGERVVGPGLACDLVDAWLGASFEGGRHLRRVRKFDPIR